MTTDKKRLIKRFRQELQRMRNGGYSVSWRNWELCVRATDLLERRKKITLKEAISLANAVYRSRGWQGSHPYWELDIYFAGYFPEGWYLL